MRRSHSTTSYRSPATTRASAASRRLDHRDVVLGERPAEHGADEGLVVHHQDPRAARAARWAAPRTPPCARGARARPARAGRGRWSPRPTALSTSISPPIAGDDRVADREAEPGADAGPLGREERVEDRAGGAPARCRCRCRAPRPRPARRASVRVATRTSCVVRAARRDGLGGVQEEVQEHLRRAAPRRRAPAAPARGRARAAARRRISFHATFMHESMIGADVHRLRVLVVHPRERLEVAHDHAHPLGAGRAPRASPRRAGCRGPRPPPCAARRRASSASRAMRSARKARFAVT